MYVAEQTYARRRSWHLATFAGILAGSRERRHDRASQRLKYPALAAGSQNVSTPSSLPSSSPGESRAALRRALVALVLAMLGLLAWQLTQEYRQLLDSQKQLSKGYSTQLAKHLSLNMRLKAQAGQAILQSSPARAGDGRELVTALRSIFPTVNSLAWLDANGQLLADSASESRDLSFIRNQQQRSGAAPYHFAFSALDGGALYLLLRQPDDSHRVLRMRTSALRGRLREQHQSEHDWLLEDLLSHRVIARADDLQQAGGIIAPVTAAEQAQSLELIALPGSDWQLRALFDAERAGNELMPTLAGKFLLFALCSLLTLLALYGLQREQRSLQRLNTETRRSLRQAASALGAVEERILVTQADGKVRYLNPQAEALFGVTSDVAGELHLLDLLPDLDPLLLNSPQLSSDLGPELIRVESEGRERLFAVTRSDISEVGRHAGYVWVLRDVTDEQQAMRVLQETRRRYQDIFEGTGVALCVLDLPACAACCCSTSCVTKPACSAGCVPIAHTRAADRAPAPHRSQPGGAQPARGEEHRAGLAATDRQRPDTARRSALSPGRGRARRPQSGGAGNPAGHRTGPAAPCMAGTASAGNDSGLSGRHP